MYVIGMTFRFGSHSAANPTEDSTCVSRLSPDFLRASSHCAHSGTSHTRTYSYAYAHTSHTTFAPCLMASTHMNPTTSLSRLRILVSLLHIQLDHGIDTSTDDCHTTHVDDDRHFRLPALMCKSIATILLAFRATTHAPHSSSRLSCSLHPQDGQSEMTTFLSHIRTHPPHV